MSLPSPAVLLRKLSQVDIKFLLAMQKVEGWLQTNGTPTLHLAVARAKMDKTALPKVAELLSKGSRVSEQNADGNTPLHVAFIKFGDALIVDMLMDRYVRETTRNLVNGDGLSVVHILCTRSYTQLLEKVLASGPLNVNEKVNQNSTSIYAGYTPLHFAVEFEQPEVAELLLARYQANQYEQDIHGSTAIHLALERGNMTMLDLLLAYDDKRENVVNDRGLSHFMAACSSTDELAVKEYLQAAPSQLRQLICGTVDDIDGYRFAGYTPLRFAVHFDRANVAGLLVATAREMTPIELASSQQDSSEDLSIESDESSGDFGLSAFMMYFLLLFMIFLLITMFMFCGRFFE